MRRRKLNSLEKKIQNLSTAIFSNESKSVLKIPTTIIQLSRIDVPGILIFPVTKPYKSLNDMGHTFPATLQFYNKRFKYCIKVIGQATVCNADDNISNAALMIRVMLKKIEYIKLVKNRGSSFGSMLSRFRQLLMLAFQ